MKRILLTLLISLLAFNPICQGQALFGSKKSINNNTGNLPSVIDSGHLDNDNYIDIIIGTTLGNTIEWYKNNGNGTFTMQTLVTSSLAGVIGLSLADLDNDMDIDIVASAYFGAKVVWYENDGNGNFSTEKIIASGIGEAGDVEVGLIDDNNTKDVVIASGSAGQVIWLPNDGNGNFGAAQLIGSDGSTPRSLDLADFNGDGDLDIVVGFISSRNVELYENQLSQSGTSTVSFQRNASGSISSGSSNINEVSFGDVDNDSKLDILKVNKNGFTSWYKKEANGSFTQTSLITAYSNPATAKVADYDDDSTNDIIVGYANTGADAMTWYDNSSPETLIDNTQDDINQITVNDFDNDGDLDVASISQSERDLNWFENLTYSPSLSTSDFEINKISVYPNPTESVLHFKSNNIQNYTVSVFDVLGKKVLNTSINASRPELNVSNLNKGIYILTFKDYNTTLKFVKQ